MGKVAALALGFGDPAFDIGSLNGPSRTSFLHQAGFPPAGCYTRGPHGDEWQVFAVLLVAVSPIQLLDPPRGLASRWPLPSLLLSDTHLCSGGLGSVPVVHNFHACALWSSLLFWLPWPHSCSSAGGRDGLRADRLPAPLYLVTRHSEVTVPVPVLSG